MNLFKNVLAVQSGGRVLSSSSGLVGPMEDSIENAGIFYSLTFDPPLAAHADEYHSLQVEVNQPSLTVDTSKGYYNQPFYNDPPDTRIQRVTVQYCQIKKGGFSQRGFIYNPSKQANHPRLVNGRISNNLKSSRNHAGIEHCFSHAESLFER
jgi:hypothetical protein